MKRRGLNICIILLAFFCNTFVFGKTLRCEPNTYENKEVASDLTATNNLLFPSPPAVLAFTTVYPKTGQTLLGNIDFSWNSKEGATNYSLQVSTNPSFSSFVLDSANLVSTTVSYNMRAIGSYYWRVLAFDGGMSIDSTNTGTFEVFNPKEMDSLSLWINGDSLSLTTANKVQQWYDLSDSARVLTQTNVTNQPDYIENYINGYNIVDFTTATGNDFFLNACDVRSRNYYISTVYNFHEATGRNCRLLTGIPGGGGSNWAIGPYLKHWLINGTGIIGSGVPIVQNRFVVNTAFARSDTLWHGFNGDLIGRGVLGNIPRTLHLGPNNNERMNGAVAEIIIVDGSVSKETRSKADKYLMDKYAPPINLGKDITVCSFPDSILLNKDYILDYRWSTGDSTGSLVIDSAGIYSIRVTDMFGRESVDTIEVVQDTANTQVAFNADTINTCKGLSVTLAAGSERFDYLWSTGDTTNEITVP